MAVTEASDYLAHFTARVIQDAINEATATYWHRRAEMYEWALPRDEDFPGGATRAEQEARRAHLLAAAQACRNRARVALIPRPIDADVLGALEAAS